MEVSVYDLFENQSGIFIKTTCMPYIQILKSEFSLEGSIINWNEKTDRHVFIGIEMDSKDVDLRIEIICKCVRSILTKNINLEEKIINFNDDDYDEAVVFDNYKTLEENLLILFKHFGQRFYFMDETANWCLCVREHSMIDFAFSIYSQ